MMVRWPGEDPGRRGLNEIVQHHDWLPTFLAAAGEPDIVEKLKQGHEAAGKTFKVHIDGYNLLPYLRGEERRARARGSSTSRTTATSSRCASTTGSSCSWSSERAARSSVGRAVRPLRVPKLFNLRTDPFERADATSNTYWDWYISKAYMIMAAQAHRRAVPRDVRGVPAAAEGGELHDRPGARADGGCPSGARD